MTHEPDDATRAADAAGRRALDRRCGRSAQSTMLPAEAYTSPTVLAWERRHLFAGTLDLPGPRRGPAPADAGRPLTQRAVSVGDVAGAADRAATATDAAGVREHLPAPRPRAAARGRHRRPSARVVCPYHAWTYDLDGALHRGARLPGRRRRSTATTHGLVELPVEVWHGWVFVQRRPARRPRRSPSTSATLDELVAPYAPERLVLGATGTRTRSRRTGRSIAENYHECYHCPLIHPELCQVSPADVAATTTTCPGPGSAARWTCATARRRCRSTGASGGRPDRRRRPAAGALPRAVPEPAGLGCTPTT